MYQNDRHIHCTRTAHGKASGVNHGVSPRRPTPFPGSVRAGQAAAQGGYFGRNKVQYRDFKFQVLKTEHFDIHFYPEEEAAARMTARMAERWYARLSKLLNHELRGRQPLILYASAPHFWQTTAIEGEMGEGTGGVTEAYKRRIVLPLAGPMHLTDHVLGHELVHAFQYDITEHQRQLGQRRRPQPAAVVHRGNGGIPVDRPGGPAHGHVDARSGPAREAARRSTSSTTHAISPIATATPCGPTSAAASATR